MNAPELEFNQTSFLNAERYFREEDAIPWLKRMTPLTWVCSALYLITIFGLQRFMKNREPLHLRPALAAWSAFLAAFSIIGAARLIPERLHTVQTHGWTYSVCQRKLLSGPVGFWTLLFILSKFFELGDTLFIVLRKQRLILLHWYHHVAVLILAFYTPAWEQPFGRWFAAINYGVHAIMYSYYTLRALKIRVPKMVSMTITITQIAQMVAGFTLTVYPFMLKTTGHCCDTSYTFLYSSFIVYVTLFILFVHFFHTAYFGKGKAGPAGHKKAD